MSSLVRQQRRVLQSQETIAQLRLTLLARSTFPKARFRVEKSKAGNSIVLEKEAAWSAQRTYGGKVVEVISEAEFLTHKAAEKDLRPCKIPICSAGQGKPCRVNGQTIAPHKNRLGKPNASRDLALGLAACTECGAPADKPCLTPRGRLRKPHQERKPLTVEQPGGSDDAGTRPVDAEHRPES